MDVRMLDGVELVADPLTWQGGPCELAQVVLDQVVTYPHTHDQGFFVDDCGTVACVCGWAQFYARGYVSHTDVERDGRVLLGLNDFDADWLFHHVNEEQARHALKFLANGQRIDWDAVGCKYPGWSVSKMRRYLNAAMPRSSVES